MNQNQKKEIKNKLFKKFRISNLLISKVVENKNIDFKNFDTELNIKIIKEESNKNDG
jgi:hypothetical protein